MVKLTVEKQLKVFQFFKLEKYLLLKRGKKNLKISIIKFDISSPETCKLQRNLEIQSIKSPGKQDQLFCVGHLKKVVDNFKTLLPIWGASLNKSYKTTIF